MTDRFYPHQKPNAEDYVMIQVTEITDLECQVWLPEYDLDGVIPLSHIFVKKGRKKKFTVQPGDLRCVEVIDPDSVPIELSAKGLDSEMVEEISERYYTVNRLHRFFKYWSDQTGTDLVQDVLWKYYDVYERLFEEKEAWQNKVPAKVVKEFEKLCKKTTEKFTIDFELACYEIDAISHIQNVIDNGLQGTTDIVCLYTGRKGSIGSIYTLTTVAETDLPLLEVLEKIKRLCEEHCVILIV